MPTYRATVTASAILSHPDFSTIDSKFSRTRTSSNNDDCHFLVYRIASHPWHRFGFWSWIEYRLVRTSPNLHVIGLAIDILRYRNIGKNGRHLLLTIDSSLLQTKKNLDFRSERFYELERIWISNLNSIAISMNTYTSSDAILEYSNTSTKIDGVFNLEARQAQEYRFEILLGPRMSDNPQGSDNLNLNSNFIDAVHPSPDY